MIKHRCGYFLRLILDILVQIKKEWELFLVPVICQIFYQRIPDVKMDKVKKKHLSLTKKNLKVR